MRKTISLLVCFAVLFGCAVTKNGPEPGRIHQETTSVGILDEAEDTDGASKAVVGCVEDVTFDRLKGKERVTLYVSRLSDFKVERISERTLLIKLANMFVPVKLRKKLGKGSLKTINYILPLQKTLLGKRWVYFEIALKEMVPYSVKEEKRRLICDFDVSASHYTFPVAVEGSLIEKELERKAMPVVNKDEPQEKKKAAKKYTGEKIFLNIQDGSIKDAFDLIAQVSGLNIVSGEEVKGKIRIYMRNVPWDQALDTILEVNGLGKKRLGNVITVYTLEEMSRKDEQRKKVEEAQIKEKAAKGTLRQVSIEAKIVEATTTFSRSLGIQWAWGYQEVLKNWGNRELGTMIGTGATGDVTTLPHGIGLTSSNMAVNFPSAIAATSPAIGIILGGNKFILDARIEALENTGKGKIISSPKVTTLDGVKATIKQGEEIPYIKMDEAGNPTIEFKEAVLQLDVKPVITPDGGVSMEINAKNDYADWTKAIETTEGRNPPIITNSVESTVVVKAGDTIVVGGIYKMAETSHTSGVPWLSKIPILGWLFKNEQKTREKREILIFVTPRVLEESVKRAL